MIVVIADDLTGAAEIAGISLRYGLTVELFLGGIEATSAEVVILCTDSRSLDVDNAKIVTAIAIEQILKLKPAIIYKKIDSVLRGHVIEEADVQMKLCGLEKVLIIPANPSLGRTIQNGEYFVDGRKITETGFSKDPEFPIKSSWVKKMIGKDAVFVLKSTDGLPGKGIVIGETVSPLDIARWVDVAADDWMLVGAGDFYSTLLEKNYKVSPRAPVELQSPHLYVCGTAFNERKNFIKTLDEKQGCVAYLPGTLDAEWIVNTCALVRKQKKAVIAIEQLNGDAAVLRVSMAKAVREIIEKEKVKEIFIEGGSTAAAVLKALGINKLSPVNELQRGVVRMKAFSPSSGGRRMADLFITVKPGSYELPAEITVLYN